LTSKAYHQKKTYNATPHRSLSNVAPKDVNETNEADLWAYMYLKPKLMNVKKEKTKRKRLFRFKIGQLVRISHQRRAFTRAYSEQWSYEVFKIKRRFQMQGIPMYKLIDMLESEIKGNFYQAELQAVDKSEDTLWNVEKIIRKRSWNNRTEVFVKWTGYSDRFNSWVDEADVKSM